MKTCFVSAPINVDLSTLQSVLQSRGYKVTFPFESKLVGVDFRTSLEKAMSKADLCVAVLSENKDNSSVLVEIGYLLGLQKKVVLMLDSKVSPPTFLNALPAVRVDLTDEEHLGHVLDHAISRLRATKRPASKSTPIHAIAGRAQELRTRLDSFGGNIGGEQLESLVIEALRDSGIQILAENPSQDHGFDLGIWIDELQDRMGNPILVEVRKKITPQIARALSEKFVESLAWMTARALVVIYLDGNEEALSKISHSGPLVLFLKVDSLLEALQNKSLPSLLWQLRNRLVHGV